MVCIELFFFYHFVVISEVLNEVFYGTWKLADIWIWSFELPLLILWLFLIVWSRTDWSFLFSVILSTVFSIYMLFLVFIFAAFSVFYLYLLLSTVFLVSIYICVCHWPPRHPQYVYGRFWVLLLYALSSAINNTGQKANRNASTCLK